jgi:hypothetical protein
MSQKPKEKKMVQPNQAQVSRCGQKRNFNSWARGIGFVLDLDSVVEQCFL